MCPCAWEGVAHSGGCSLQAEVGTRGHHLETGSLDPKSLRRGVSEDTGGLVATELGWQLGVLHQGNPGPQCGAGALRPPGPRGRQPAGADPTNTAEESKGNPLTPVPDAEEFLPGPPGPGWPVRPKAQLPKRGTGALEEEPDPQDTAAPWGCVEGPGPRPQYLGNRGCKMTIPPSSVSGSSGPINGPECMTICPWRLLAKPWHWFQSCGARARVSGKTRLKPCPLQWSHLRADVQGDAAGSPRRGPRAQRCRPSLGPLRSPSRLPPRSKGSRQWQPRLWPLCHRVASLLRCQHRVCILASIPEP